MAFVMDMKRMIDQVAYFEMIMEFPAQLLRKSDNIKVHADFALAVIRRARVLDFRNDITTPPILLISFNLLLDPPWIPIDPLNALLVS